MNLIISFAVLIVTMLFGLPIPIAFFSTCIYLLLAEGMDPSFMIPYGMGQINSYIIIAVPMFILAGAIMEKGGIGDKLVSFVERATGRVKGGIGLVTIIACGIFGAISGSATATVTAIGSIMQPRLEKSGYSRGMSASLIASAGILGMLIPPSGIMIMFCWVANQSVLAAFLSSAMAGITLIVFLSIVNLVL